jgi:hypothetical protein
MEHQYLVPGGAYVNEDTDRREVLLPGGAYLNETSVAGASPQMIFQSGVLTPNAPFGYL